MKNGKITKTICSAGAIATAAAAVAVFTGGPRVSAAADMKATAGAGRAVCAKPGLVDFFLGPGTVKDFVQIPRVGFVAAGWPMPATHISYPTVVSSEVAGGHVWNNIGDKCLKAVDQLPISTSAQAAVLPAHNQIRCSFPQGLETRQIWNGRPYDVTAGMTMPYANGVSTKPTVVVKIGATIKLTYNPRVCHRVPFGTRMPGKPAAPTATSGP